jgi:hypothetical protein
MKPAWIALAMMVACGALAESQPPAPTIPVEKSSPPQKATQKKGRAANSDQRGTEDRPLFVSVVGVPVVEVQGGPQAEQKATETANKENNGSTLYWGVAIDAWIAAFTLGLFVIGALTAIVFIFQSILLRRQLGEMVKAIDLGNREFISTHRPRLRVRRFRANVSPIAISYVVVNIGGSAAHIKKSEITVMVPVQVGHDWKECVPELLPMEARTLASGESYLFIARPAKLIEHRCRRDIEIRGIIDYTDDAKVTRQTAFWRIHDPKSQSFSAKGGPDYEYED